MSEVWRAIPSLPEYLASSEGRVMRLPYSGEMPKGGLRSYGGEPWFGVWEKSQARFIIQFRGKTYRVSRLICEAFHGSAPDSAPVCMHLDENSANNRSANLQWGTQQENLNAPGFVGYSRSGRAGERHHPREAGEPA